MKGFSFSFGGASSSKAQAPSRANNKRVNVFAHDEEEQRDTKKARESVEAAVVEHEEEEDELDAFMNQIEQDAAAPSSGAGVADGSIRLGDRADHEEQPHLLVPMFETDEQTSALEEVGNIPVLEPVDHSAISYPLIRGVDTSSLTALRDKQTVPGILQYMTGHGIQIEGAGNSDAAVMPYLTSFDQMLLPYSLHHKLTQSYAEGPTLIQQAAIPFILNGRDIIGIAPTGSGKSGIFLWTLIAQVSNQQPSSGVASPQAIVIVPTRELASQLFKLCNRYCNLINGAIKCMGVFGNTSSAAATLSKSSPEIVIATPGRLLQFIKKKFIKTREVRYFVVDEADKLLSMGFEEQLNSIVGQLRPDRQTIFCSATFPNRVMKFASNILKTDRVKINIGRIGAVNTDIVQVPVVLQSRDDKYRWLMSNLNSFLSDGSVVVFVNQRVESEQLARTLLGSGFSCVALHGNKSQQERQRIFHAFTSGAMKLLVATDIASRGLDVSTVNTIVQYEPPKDIDTYTHRVGRCGRAGREGYAYSLMTPGDLKLASILFKSLRSARQEVPEIVSKMSRQYQAGRGGKRNQRRGLGYH